MRGFKSFAPAGRFCRGHDELRNLLRPRTRHTQRIPANRRRLLHLRAGSALAMLEAAQAEPVSRLTPSGLARVPTEPDGHVGDRVLATRHAVALREAAVEHVELAPSLHGEPADRVFDLRRRVPVEVADPPRAVAYSRSGRSHVVTAGLVLATHALARREKAWMAVTSTGMTSNKTGRERHVRSPCEPPVEVAEPPPRHGALPTRQNSHGRRSARATASVGGNAPNPSARHTRIAPDSKRGIGA